VFGICATQNRYSNPSSASVGVLLLNVIVDIKVVLCKDVVLWGIMCRRNRPQKYMYTKVGGSG
jgi:hypothetical protein